MNVPVVYRSVEEVLKVFNEEQVTFSCALIISFIKDSFAVQKFKGCARVAEYLQQSVTCF